MYRFLYLCNNILAGIILGVFAPALLVFHLASKTKRYFYLNAFFGLFLIVLLTFSLMTLFNSILYGILVYFTPWAIIAIINDFSIFDEEELEDEEVNPSTHVVE